MDKLELRGNWNQLKGKLRQKYSQLTDKDLTYVKGKKEELIGRLQKKLGKSRSEVIAVLNKL